MPAGKMGILVVVVVAASLFFSASPDLVSEQEKMLYPTWDGHLHYLDFTQSTDGFAALVEEMDEAGVEAAVIFGMPMVKMWSESDPERPDYYLDSDSRAYYFTATDYILAQELLAQEEEVQERFYPFISGINPLDLNSVDYIEILLELYPDFWRGIGEVMSRHDDLTAFTYGEPPRADHPALMRVYGLAAEHDLPVLIHHNITSIGSEEPLYLPELERALQANPDTDFIWAHAGMSRRLEVPDHLEELERLLSSYPNAHVDISWVVYDEHILRDARSLNDWVQLIEEHPDRFIIGTDQVGHWEGYVEEITKYNTLLQELDESSARMISKENIKGLVEPR